MAPTCTGGASSRAAIRCQRAAGEPGDQQPFAATAVPQVGRGQHRHSRHQGAGVRESLQSGLRRVEREDNSGRVTFSNRRAQPDREPRRRQRHHRPPWPGCTHYRVALHFGSYTQTVVCPRFWVTVCLTEGLCSLTAAMSRRAGDLAASGEAVRRGNQTGTCGAGAAGQTGRRPRAWPLVSKAVHAARAGGWVTGDWPAGPGRQRIWPSRRPYNSRVRSRRAATLAMFAGFLPAAADDRLQEVSGSSPLSSTFFRARVR